MRSVPEETHMAPGKQRRRVTSLICVPVRHRRLLRFDIPYLELAQSFMSPSLSSMIISTRRFS